MIWEGIEEFVWFWSDMEINRAPVEKLINGKVFEKTSTGKLKPGDIIKVKEDEAFPADIVLLKTANIQQTCFIQTSSLDGEKALKKRKSPKIEQYYGSGDEINLIGGCIAEKQNPDLYQFSGYLKISGQTYGLDINNFLLKGANLKNTEWIVGLVVYTGRDTKIMLNS